MHAYAADRFTTEDGRTTLRFGRDDARRIDGATIDLAGGERALAPVRSGDGAGPTRPQGNEATR
jgi:hypothetical protein